MMHRSGRWGSRRQQQGIGLWGWMSILAVFGFVIYTFTISFPKYMEYFDVRSVMEWAASQPELVKAPPAEIRSRIQRRIDTGYVKVVSSKMIKVRRKKTGGRELHVDWEVREPFMGNVDVVWKFEVTTDLRGTPPS